MSSLATTFTKLSLQPSDPSFTQSSTISDRWQDLEDRSYSINIESDSVKMAIRKDDTYGIVSYFAAWPFIEFEIEDDRLYVSVQDGIFKVYSLQKGKRAMEAIKLSELAGRTDILGRLALQESSAKTALHGFYIE
ncbi:MAG: hypothetical protein S4CHLAM81_07550 [Chlamydiales bacterium]|nr:hypothetical protein [Chlamydiales bacterium]MCH9635538.1 hypothetical protein [Chlamydiales bacterium]MCH9704127.1 hypothetical protein [Chlamydiota bacterium]